ncbi:putative transcriptional regulator, AsnC family protein [Halogeometricum pallidum JCM 14848]|uniref:Putative transcriptional regulator, AsnC family protein n=1 Tax=Halogeometricum pallidum JCM 14848 TaxID=1227487 RepID=M0CZK5_HALPD|nr:winged helix-turn-helix transcriptional regulator [Halogeometricum pallidum]ELZ28038.1 putative transcriptional regulator, AsnC family protein [Halogeometricum pallidum JCM 14848]
MTELDETDVDILRLLMEDSRRSFRGIAEEVNRSPPTVSNRVERLRELGIIRRFTLELDRTLLSGADETLVIVEAYPRDAEEVLSRLESEDGVEHVFRTVESRIIAKTTRSPSEIQALLRTALEGLEVRDYRVESVLDSSWQPQLEARDFDVKCSVCGNTVSGEGETVEVESGDLYHVCCASCAEKISAQYESLAGSTDE